MTPALRWYKKQAAINRGRGLTVKGNVFKRRPNARTRGERLALRRQRSLDSWNRLVARRAAAGLNSRGGPKVPTVLVGQPTRALLISQIDDLARSLFEIFDALPLSAQAKTIELSNHLSAIRTKCL